jgi:hypothetical protein
MNVSAGKDIDAWCTKCKMLLEHRVVAAVGGRPARVLCLTCKSEHNYRPAPANGATATATKGAGAGPAAKSKSKAKAKAAAGKPPVVAPWQDRVPGRANEDFIAYSPSRVFLLNALIEHSRFGRGYVSEVIDSGKVNVIFREGPRVLAHGRA